MDVLPFVRCLSPVINQQSVAREESKLPLLLPVDQTWSRAASLQKETLKKPSLTTENNENLQDPQISPLIFPLRQIQDIFLHSLTVISQI